ncbi:uncharacterized protein LOC122643420 [Telopea speciosissima]|uniref:uncharacterized protein LOC122643420 n=1 Tax=Telopea speciosissima TaxID=54955 RepID=UPI001CC7F3F9|nr:uncharacterized protein LOC122643420 [Telopea speciosissima]
MKLNVDGASKGNSGPSGGGGVIRDSSGNVVMAFANFYGHCTNTEAEMRLILDGLQLCASKGYHGCQTFQVLPYNIYFSIDRKDKASSLGANRHWTSFNFVPIFLRYNVYDSLSDIWNHDYYDVELVATLQTGNYFTNNASKTLLYEM